MSPDDLESKLVAASGSSDHAAWDELVNSLYYSAPALLRLWRAAIDYRVHYVVNGRKTADVLDEALRELEALR